MSIIVAKNYPICHVRWDSFLFVLTVIAEAVTANLVINVGYLFSAVFVAILFIVALFAIIPAVLIVFGELFAAFFTGIIAFVAIAIKFCLVLYLITAEPCAVFRKITINTEVFRRVI